jgi:hypothetical protein
MLRNIIRRDVVLKRNTLLCNVNKVNLSSKADPDQKLRDNVRYSFSFHITSIDTNNNKIAR